MAYRDDVVDLAKGLRESIAKSGDPASVLENVIETRQLLDDLITIIDNGWLDMKSESIIERVLYLKDQLAAL